MRKAVAGLVAWGLGVSLAAVTVDPGEGAQRRRAHARRLRDDTSTVVRVRG